MWAYSPYLPLESEHKEGEDDHNETKRVRTHVHVLIRTTKKGRLGCKSSCHICPALHRRAGPVGPRDNTPWPKAIYLPSFDL